MTWRWYYSVDASTVLEITDRVRLPLSQGDATPASIGSHAEEGSGWSGEIEVDDPAGDLIMLQHRRIYSTNDAAPSGGQVVGNWFIQDLDVVRMDPWDATARRWLVTMVDENSLLSRRIFVGADSDRPAETDIVRIRWLLTTTELNTVDKDEAFIDTAGAVTLDAADYTKQKPESVLEHCKKASGKNYWIKYGEAAAVGGAIVSSSVANPSVITTTTAHGLTTGMSVVIAGHSGSTPTINGTRVVTVTGANTFTVPLNVTVGGTGGTTTTIGRYQLCYFNAATSSLYPSTIGLSNLASEIDSSTIYAISDDTRLNRAGGRAPASGVVEPYASGTVYEQDTTVGDTYVYRDIAAPSVNVKTAAKATAIATRELAEVALPDDEVETEIVVQAAAVNLAMHGMLIPVRATHLPNYTSESDLPGYANTTNMRIMRRQVRQIGPTTFGIRLWLTPTSTPVPIYMLLMRAEAADIISGGVNESLGFASTGDAPPNPPGGTPIPTTGPIEAIAGMVSWAGTTPVMGVIGARFLGTGTVNYRTTEDLNPPAPPGPFQAITAANGITATIDMLINGLVVDSVSAVTVGAGGASIVFNGSIDVVTGDELTFRFRHDSGTFILYVFDHDFEITGNLVPA